MSIQRYKLTQPIQTQSMVNQLPQGVAITLVGQSPGICVDLDLAPRPR
jgi:hypothetical protein